MKDDERAIGFIAIGCMLYSLALLHSSHSNRTYASVREVATQLRASVRF